MAAYFTNPTSYRIANNLQAAFDDGARMPFAVFKKPHDSHPSLPNLVMLVFEAVLEVVCVALPGYIIARLGYFDAEKQKFLANLNVMLFTPCLIFTKLAAQLNADKLVELGVIPVIFIVQTLVSYCVSIGVSKAFRFNKRATNFVTAMGVFGNSNSLPISLVISLSQTLKGLHWDKIPGDNDDEVGARGILYLLIFQQLGQLVRWSWGYHVLLAPKDKYEEYDDERAEEGQYRDDPFDDAQETDRLLQGETQTYMDGHPGRDDASDALDGSEVYEPAGRTPVAGHSRAHSRASPSDSEDDRPSSAKKRGRHSNGAHPPDFTSMPDEPIDGIQSFPRISNTDEPELPGGIKGLSARIKIQTKRTKQNVFHSITQASHRTFDALPRPLQKCLTFLGWVSSKVFNFIWEFMNPPLWAMLIALVVASVPELQRVFFSDGTFINNSVTHAVTQNAGVAVPLILVVLGANLARNTQSIDTIDPEEEAMGKKLLIASLICRMLLPTLIMAPMLALIAKYVPVSILDDPIFVIVCFLLTGAPSALQLAQICQLNSVFEKTMAKILFQGYVIWILPSTLILVMCALEVVEWAT